MSKNATYKRKLNVLEEVLLVEGEKELHFTLNYSRINLSVKDMPKLMADLLIVAKPLISADDKKLANMVISHLVGAESEKEQVNNKAESTDTKADEPIDLSDIPF